MPKKQGKNQHVVRREDGWAVRGEGNSKDTVRTGTKREAIERAREIAANQGTEVVVHGRDGMIRDRTSYGNDLVPPRDKRHTVPSRSSTITSETPTQLVHREKHIGERIVIDPKVVHGKPHIAGTRIMVYQILDLLSAGKTIEEIISDDYFPDLTTEDVVASIDYAARVMQNDVPRLS